MRLLASVAGVTHAVEVDEANEMGLVRVKVDDREYWLDVTNPAPGLYSLVVHGQVFGALVSQRRGKREVQLGNFSTSVDVVLAQGTRPTARASAVISGRQEITAPMSGRVVQVLVHPGQTVQEGETLLILEAMKMETEIRAVARGQVRDIQVAAEMTVDAGQLLLIVEAS